MPRRFEITPGPGFSKKRGSVRLLEQSCRVRHDALKPNDPKGQSSVNFVAAQNCYSRQESGAQASYVAAHC
jgi:hypothetical protein